MRLLFERLGSKHDNTIDTDELQTMCEQEGLVEFLFAPASYGNERKRLTEKLYEGVTRFVSNSRLSRKRASFDEFSSFVSRTRLSARRSVSARQSDHCEDAPSDDEEETMTDEQLQELRVMKLAFSCCDIDGDGSISTLELKNTYMKHPEIAAFLGIGSTHKVHEVFKQLDTDGAGEITWEKFKNFVQKHREEKKIAISAVGNNSGLRLIFESCGVSEDGTISMKDFVEACAKSESIADFILPSDARGEKRKGKTVALVKAIQKAGKGRAFQKRASFEDFSAILQQKNWEDITQSEVDDENTASSSSDEDDGDSK